MTTRWDLLRENFKKLAAIDRVTSEDTKLLEELMAKEFKCSICKYFNKENHKFLCGMSSSKNCRQGFANYLNEEVDG